jgi:lysophospholipase
MSRPLRGEMTEAAQPSFSHPHRNMPMLASADAAFAALGYAIRNGDIAAVRDLLDGDDVGHHLLTRGDYAGNTAVHLAGMAPHPDVLRELLLRGASVHVRNAANNTPLFLAEQIGNAEAVKLLREAGAHLWKDTEVVVAQT